MIELSDANKELKNSLFDDSVWLSLITLTNRDESVVIRIVNNTEDIVYHNKTFTKFPCKIGEVTESNKGELQTISIVISNVDKLVQSYVEADEYVGTGWKVHIDIIHSSDVATGTAEITYNFLTMNVSASDETVTLLCGIKNPIRALFPRIRMLSNACQNTFKRGGCTYIGADETCSKRLQDCRQKFPDATKIPFFGFPGIPTTGIYK